MNTILGAGLAGISSSYHLGHENCIVFEKNEYSGGHIHSYEQDNCIWDEGPHVSFTKNKYVIQLFEKNVDNEFFDYSVKVANHFNGSWVPHPAQTNLFAIPEPLRSECLNSFLASRNKDNNKCFGNYEDWLISAFGEKFYEIFPKIYTEKYWTVSPSEMTTDWVGERVFYPNIDEVKNGFVGPLDNSKHYITFVRYPKLGGYFSYAKKMTERMNTQHSHKLEYISFKDKNLFFSNGVKHEYDTLISTIPLPTLISKSDAPDKIKIEASKLKCTSVLLVNVIAKHTTIKDFHWLYVYDKKYYSTRINFSEMLSKNNAPLNTTAIQVEVYFSDYKKLDTDIETIAKKVCQELIEMGLIYSYEKISSFHTKWVQWANVIFDHNRKTSLDIILDWLKFHGLERNNQDLLPTTNWSSSEFNKNAKLHLAGRFAEWKYYWTDDCVLRGKAFE